MALLGRKLFDISSRARSSAIVASMTANGVADKSGRVPRLRQHDADIYFDELLKVLSEISSHRHQIITKPKKH
jgi:hypothetical protein